MYKHIIIAFLFINTTFLPSSLTAQQLPENFYAELVSTDWQNIVGLTFDKNGQMYGWEKGGFVYTVDTNGVKFAQPLVDISEEVGAWRDHGLLGFTLHPNFLNNGYFYLFYAVDNHYLLEYGTSTYNADSTYAFKPSQGRVTRYTADIATGFKTIIPNSRKIILGENIGNNIVLLHESHGIGTLAFGSDESLLISCGDGSSYGGSDVGGDEFGAYATEALANGMITPDQDIGSYKAQYLGSHNGKVLRVNPENGDGLPSNPFYDANNPNSAQSRTFALGFRNPFKMVFRPNTGSHYIGDGDPGSLFVGDVGASSFEEINVVRTGGQNFGWPLTEGMNPNYLFTGKPAPENQLAPNPLSSNNCNKPYFTFKELLLSSTLNTTNNIYNPCNATELIPSSVFPMQESLPAVSWSNALWNLPTRTFVNILDAPVEISTPQSSVQGVSFDGTSSIPGVFYQGDAFPEEYKDALFCSDFSGWIRIFRFDDQDVLQDVELFYEPQQAIVNISENPKDGCLYYVSYDVGIYKISYGGTPSPVAVIEVDTFYGGNELTVNFDASSSYSPAAVPIQYEWNFGDGSPIDTNVQIAHTFTTTSSEVTSFSVSLTITDSTGKTKSTEKIISLNNTPPEINIISFQDGDLFPARTSSILELKADITDKESDLSELTYEWQTHVHHNVHFHSEPIDNMKDAFTVISPVGCTQELFYYRISLRVIDEGGLESTVEQYLYPNCEDPFTTFIDLNIETVKNGSAIQWTTENEDSVAIYEVQHSTNNLYFETIGEQLTSANRQYELLHSNPIVGLNYYRIKARRLNNAYLYSKSKKSYYNTDKLQRNAYVFPNPAKEQLNIVFKTPAEYASFKLFNNLGQQIIFEINLEDLVEDEIIPISIFGIKSGIYHYQIITDNETIINGTILFQQ